MANQNLIMLWYKGVYLIYLGWVLPDMQWLPGTETHRQSFTNAFSNFSRDMKQEA